MKVKAKVNVNYNGVWKRPGEMFEVSTTDEDVLKYVDVVETPIHEPETAAEAEAPKKRGRPRRADIEGT